MELKEVLVIRELGLSIKEIMKQGYVFNHLRVYDLDKENETCRHTYDETS